VDVLGVGCWCTHHTLVYLSSAHTHSGCFLLHLAAGVSEGSLAAYLSLDCRGQQPVIVYLLFIYFIFVRKVELHIKNKKSRRHSTGAGAARRTNGRKNKR